RSLSRLAWQRSSPLDGSRELSPEHPRPSASSDPTAESSETARTPVPPIHGRPPAPAYRRLHADWLLQVPIDLALRTRSTLADHRQTLEPIDRLAVHRFRQGRSECRQQ